MDFTTLEQLAGNPAYTLKAQQAYFRLRLKRREESRVTTSPCWLPCDDEGNLLRANESGYTQRVIVQPSGAANRSGQGGLRITAYVHQLGWWQKSRFNPVVVQSYRAMVQRGLPMVVSHLCHNSRCFRPSHLTVEPRWVNEYRRICLLKRGGQACHCHYSRRGRPWRYKTCLT